MINDLDVRKLLALILVISYVALIAALCFLPAKTIESDTVKTLLGSLSALVALAGNFYFTSSAGNDGKDKTIATIATGQGAPPAAPSPPAGSAPWWSLLTADERAKITEAATRDARAQTFTITAAAGKAEVDDLIYLVRIGALTQERAATIATS